MFNLYGRLLGIFGVETEDQVLSNKATADEKLREGLTLVRRREVAQTHGSAEAGLPVGPARPAALTVELTSTMNPVAVSAMPFDLGEIRG